MQFKHDRTIRVGTVQVVATTRIGKVKPTTYYVSVGPVEFVFDTPEQRDRFIKDLEHGTKQIITR